MARLASRVPDVVPLTAAERWLAAWLRFFAAIFAAGAVIFFFRPAGTVADLDRVGLLLGLAPLPPASGPVAADFWLTLAVANMAAIAACAGLGRHCPARRVLGIVGADGAFADLVALPARNLHRVPDSVPDRAAVFVEPLAAAFEVLEQVAVGPGVRAVVLGDGKLGLLVAQVLAGAGAGVVLVGHHAEKLARVRRLGIETRPPDAGADLVVDATGSPGGLAAALALVRPRGTIVLKTTVAGEHRLDLAPAVINEVTVVGSRCGPFAPALAALAGGRIAVAPLVDAVYPLDDAVGAFTRAAEPGVLKVLIEAGG